MKKKSLRICVAGVCAAVMMLAPITAAAASIQDFWQELNPLAWYGVYVSPLIEEGAIGGYPDGTFRKDDTITAAEYLTIIVKKTLGAQQATDHWAGGYFAAAREKGILPEGMLEDQSAWDRPISREQMAVIAARTAEFVLNEDKVTNTDSYKAQISDYSKVCDYCKDYVVQCYAKSILAGYPDGTFRPDGELTRVEACAAIAKLFDETLRVPQAGSTPVGKTITFDPAKDMNADGTMTEAKAIEFMDQILATVKFYGEGGKYYVTCTYPELPDGFEWGFGVTVEYTTATDRPAWGITTGWTMREDAKIATTGTITREIPSMKAVSEVKLADFGISIVNAEKKESVAYYVQNVTNRLVIQRTGDAGGGVNYDVSKNFVWK